MNDIGNQLVCGMGLILAILFATWPLWSGLFRRHIPPPESSEPITQAEKNAQARALQIAALPFARRVKAIHDVIIAHETSAPPAPEIQDP